MSTQGTISSLIQTIPAPARSVTVLRAGGALAVLGALLSALGLVFTDSLGRLAHGYLLGFSFVWTVCLGSLLLVALHHLTSAVWSVVLRRVMELFASRIGLVAILFLPLLIIAYVGHETGMFPWLTPEVAADHIVHGKAPYLNLPFFTLRAVLFFAIWFLFGKFFVGRSIKQDNTTGDERSTLLMRKLSAPFVILFAFTITFAGIDWLMSQSPLWYSTMFGVYIFSGMIVSALAAITLSAYKMIDSGRLGQGIINDNHIYNLGTLMFAFTVFWGYIAFSQYFLIWYANMPEESFYMVQRVEGGWLNVTVLLALVRFVIPFMLLLSRRAKTLRSRLIAMSIVILFGQLLDLYWLIMPQIHESEPTVGWQEIGPVLFCSGVFLLTIGSFLGKHKAIAVGDPLLEKSIWFQL